MKILIRGANIKVDVNGDFNGQITKIKTNTVQYPTIVVILERGAMTILTVKVVYIALVNLYETRGELKAAVEYHIKLYDDICKKFYKGIYVMD